LAATQPPQILRAEKMQILKQLNSQQPAKKTAATALKSTMIIRKKPGQKIPQKDRSAEMPPVFICTTFRV